MAKMVEMVKMDASDIRLMCIRNNWYTAGTYEQYLRMLARADVEEATVEDIAGVAEDIIAHTPAEEFYGIGDDDKILACVMFEVRNECCKSHYRKSE